MAQLTQLDIDLMAWQKAEADRAAAVETEMALRKKVFAQAFPNAEKGTNNFELGGGFILKGVKKLNYNLTHTKDGQETDAVLEQIEKLGNEGQFIADRLVSWKPSLSLTEYQNLNVTGATANPTHVKIKALIDSVLTISDGAPTLEVVVPKAAK